jgi:GSCFA family
VPILDIDSAAAFERLDGQRHGRWSHVIAADGQSGDFVGGPFYRPTLRRPFSVNDQSSGYVIGSCFAQQVQFALGKRHVPLRSSILDSPIESWFLQDGKDHLPLHFFHRFNPASLLQEFEHILSETPAIADGALIYERPDGLFSDCHYNARFTLPDLAGCLARREFIRRRINALVDVEFVIITLGMTEAWVDAESGLYLNTTPPKELVEHLPARFRFRVLGESDVVESLSKILGLLYRTNPQMKVVLTVSPIPLAATFTGQDIAVANANSKATLLCAATRLVLLFPQMFYFPSYEIVTHSDRAAVWERDGRHVRADFVERIMDYFCASTFDAPCQSASPGFDAGIVP